MFVAQTAVITNLMAGKCLIFPKVEARLFMFITECNSTVDFNQQAALVCEQRCPSPFRRRSHFHLCCRRISGNSVAQISPMSKSWIFPPLDLRSGCPRASAVTNFDHCESDTFEDKTSLSHMPAKLRRWKKKNKPKTAPCSTRQLWHTPALQNILASQAGAANQT